MSIFHNNALIGASGRATAAPTAYNIERSLRFNSADSAYLSRTPASAGNRKTWTWAGWVKVSASNNGTLFSATATNSGASDHRLNFLTDRLQFQCWTSGNVVEVTTTAVFRDFSAWYHIVLALDTTQPTAADRVKFYVNGSQLTLFSTSTYPSQNFEPVINAANRHAIGRNDGNASNYFSGYLADIHFIDGQALTPTSFGGFDANNVWQPKAYTGSYGTNGFRLPFSNNASTTTISQDSSGNNNHWTANNISVTANTGNTIQSIRVQDGVNADAGFSTIRVDGVILVQGAGTPDYRSFVSANVPYIYGTSVANTFTSNLASAAFVGSGGIITFAPSPGITYNSTVEIWTGADGNNLVSFNNGPWVSVSPNTWTVIASNSLSAQGDSLVDSPTNYGTDTGAGGQVRSNYCTLNPLDKDSNITLSNGNLTSTSATRNVLCRSTVFVSSGKWYHEALVTAAADNLVIGWANASAPFNNYLGISAGGWGYTSDGTKRNNGAITAYGASFTVGDIIGVAANLDAGTIVFYKNGVSQGTAFSNLSGTLCPAFSLGTSTIVDCNWGARPFAYTAPSGFKALCTANLPTPTIANGATAMDVKLYTGNGSTQTISGLGFSPDLVWIKNRQDTLSWNLFNDTVRGANKILASNETGAEYTNDINGYLSAFTSDGFTVVNGGNGIQVNGSNKAFVAWAFDAGSSTVTNTSGTISSQVRANPSAGFSIVTASVPDTASGPTIGHGLGVTPAFVIGKNRSAAIPWYVWNASLPANNLLQLQSTAAATTTPTAWGQMTSSTLQMGATGTAVNVSWVVGGTQNFVFYCFAPVAGYSSFGSYTGNGSADGPFVYTGFRPRWILVKRTDSTSNWTVWDAARNTFNYAGNSLYPNLSNAEDANTPTGGAQVIDILSNGFKLRDTGGTGQVNASGGAYVWAAFAESPFAYSRAR